jgi:hypothetical protein
MEEVTMFRALILGIAAIILSMAGIAYLLIQNSDSLKQKATAKFCLYGIVAMAVVVFLLSFKTIRFFLAGIFL